MSKVAIKRKSMSAYPKIVQDHGLELPYDRGELAIEVCAETIEGKKHKVKVTRLRRVCAYDEMMNRGTITKKQRDCAERYAILCEKALGNTGDLYAKINLLRVGSSNGHWEISQKISDAYEVLFEIWRELGKYHTHILDMIVLNNYNCKKLSNEIGTSYQYVIGQVMSSFILLEEYFDNTHKK